MGPFRQSPNRGSGSHWPAYPAIVAGRLNAGDTDGAALGGPPRDLPHSRLILAGVAIEVLLVACYYVWERTRLTAWARERKVEVSSGIVPPTWWPEEQDGVIRPPTVEAPKAGLKDEEKVLGVEVNGVARAYRLATLCDVTRHIVNDTVNGVPISVLYCDLSDCAAATRARQARPAADPNGGHERWRHGAQGRESVLPAQSAEALEGTESPSGPDPSLPPFPFSPTTVTRTTWGAWKQQHPKTHVYLGARGEDTKPNLPAKDSAALPGKADRKTGPPDNHLGKRPGRGEVTHRWDPPSLPRAGWSPVFSACDGPNGYVWGIFLRCSTSLVINATSSRIICCVCFSVDLSGIVSFKPRGRIGELTVELAWKARLW